MVRRPRRPLICLIRSAALAPLGVLLLVIAVLWLGAAIHGLVAGNSAIVPGLGAGGAYLVGALGGVALALLALDWIVRGRTVVIESECGCSDRSLAARGSCLA